MAQETLRTGWFNLGIARYKLRQFDKAYDAFASAGDLTTARYRDRGASGSDDDARAWLGQSNFIFTSQVSAAWSLAHQP